MYLYCSENPESLTGGCILWKTSVPSETSPVRQAPAGGSRTLAQLRFIYGTMQHPEPEQNYDVHHRLLRAGLDEPSLV